jgi:hypothetical protein
VQAFGSFCDADLLVQHPGYEVNLKVEIKRPSRRPKHRVHGCGVVVELK